MKSLRTLAIEALIVGFLLVVMFKIVGLLGMRPVVTVFLTGALFHLTCEYTGVNEWYARNYFL